MYNAKTKALIRFAVTAKLICVFVFAYVNRWFSHDAAHFFIPLICINVFQMRGISICLRSFDFNKFT